MVGRLRAVYRHGTTVISITLVHHKKQGAYGFTDSLEQQDKGFRPAALTHRSRPITLHLARRFFPLYVPERLTAPPI